MADQKISGLTDGAPAQAGDILPAAREVSPGLYENVGLTVQSIVDKAASEIPAGSDGDDGWTPVVAIVDDGTRRVLQLTDWAGGTGDKPASGLFVGVSGFVADIADAIDIRGAAGDPGQPGADGADGDDGWSPVFAIVADGERRVQQVSDWTGGTGTKPATGKYVGASGLVSAIGSAVDIRGPAGSSSGGGSGYDPIGKAQAFEDFLTGATSSFGPFGITSTSSGSAASVTTGTSLSMFGSKILSTGSTSSGSSILAGATSINTYAIASIAFSTRINLNNIATATEKLQVLLGLSSSPNSLTPGDLVAFRYDPDVSPNWLGKCSTSILDTGVPVAGATVFDLRFVMDAAQSSAEFFINGVSVGAAGPFLSFGVGLGVSAIIQKTAGTFLRSMEVDYFFVEYGFTSPRV